MANESRKSAISVPAKDASDPAFDVTLEEFCEQLSSSITKPELIGGFYHQTKKRGFLKGSTAAFKEQFDAFKNQPL